MPFFHLTRSKTTVTKRGHHIGFHYFCHAHCLFWSIYIYIMQFPSQLSTTSCFNFHQFQSTLTFQWTGSSPRITNPDSYTYGIKQWACNGAFLCRKLYMGGLPAQRISLTQPQNPKDKTWHWPRRVHHLSIFFCLSGSEWRPAQQPHRMKPYRCKPRREMFYLSHSCTRIWIFRVPLILIQVSLVTNMATFFPICGKKAREFWVSDWKLGTLAICSSPEHEHCKLISYATASLFMQMQKNYTAKCHQITGLIPIFNQRNAHTHLLCSRIGTWNPSVILYRDAQAKRGPSDIEERPVISKRPNWSLCDASNRTIYPSRWSIPGNILVARCWCLVIWSVAMKTSSRGHHTFAACAAYHCWSNPESLQ